MKKITKDILIIILGLIALVFVWGGWQTFQVTKVGDEEVFCTADAKMCPDGTYVGRVAPDCEFAACPGN